MTIKQLNPYLNFDGTAAKAIELYQRALGAKVENVQRFGDMPGSDPASKDRILHAVLKLGAGVVMLSDTMPGTPFTPGGNAHVCLDYDNPVEMGANFELLASGGKVTMPLQDTFWGARFGMLTDAFGVRWMFNCQSKQS